MTGRVTICGAFGGVNIGDEAIAETMRAQLGRAFPSARVGLICFVRRAVLAQTGYAMAETDIASREDWGTALRWLRAGPLVIGGGQMLNGSGLAKGPGYLLALAWMARLCGRPVFILGVGTRAIERFTLSRWCIRRLAAAARVIRVRDVQSRQALMACGVPEARIEVTADVVFSGIVAPPADAVIPRDPSHICLAVHQSPLVTHYGPADYAGFVQALAEARGATRIDLVCHDARPGYDLEFAHAVAAALKGRTAAPVSVLAPASVAEAMALYAEAGLVASSRMHPLILGLAAGAQVLPLAGSAKVADLATLYGAGPLPEVGAATGDLPAMLRPPAEGGALMQGIPEELRARSQANFAGLDGGSVRKGWPCIR